MFEYLFWDECNSSLCLCVYKLSFVRFIDIKTTRNIFSKDQKSHKIWRALFVCSLVRSFVVCFGEFLFSWIVIVSEHARFYFHFIPFRWKDSGVYAFWLNWKHTRTQSQVTCVIDNFRLSHIIKTHTHAYAHANTDVHTFHYLRFVSFLFLSFQSISKSRVMNWEFICSILFSRRFRFSKSFVFSSQEQMHSKFIYRWF